MLAQFVAQNILLFGNHSSIKDLKVANEIFYFYKAISSCETCQKKFTTILFFKGSLLVCTLSKL